MNLHRIKINDKKAFVDRFVNILERFGRFSVFLVIQRSLVIVLPLIIIGALGLTIRYFPSPAVISFFDRIFGKEWTVLLDNVNAGTLGIVSLAVLCTFSGTMTMIINQKRRGPFISPIMSIVVVLSCFFILCSPYENNSWVALFSMGRGLVPAFFISIAGCSLFLRLARFRAMNWSMGTVGHDPVVRDILTVLPAGMMTIIVAVVTRMFLDYMGIANIHDSIRNILFLPFSHAKDGLGFGLCYTGLSQLFWLFGAHGPNLLFGVEDHILVPAIQANQLAVSQGLAPTLIFTKPFFDLYTRIGGSGSTICLIFAMLLKSRDNGARKLCLLALVPGLCNVNEPILFGIPLVLNPVYVIPFIITPVLQTIIAYLATVAGVITHTTQAVTWTTPVLLSGYVSTGSLSGPLLQALNVLVGVACYMPFVMLSDRLRERQGETLLKKLKNAALNHETKSKGMGLLDIPGEEGRFAKALAGDLKVALKTGTQLYLVYQPQVSDSGGYVSGVEALLRWNHPVYGGISPEITVSIAEELGVMDRLGNYILVEACRERAAWKRDVPEAFTMSVNLVPQQLIDPIFSGTVFETLEKFGLSTQMIELEITESNVLEPDEITLTTLERFHKSGIRIAIDDFGMGHTSLRYLRSFPVSTIKIDRSLTMGDAREVNNQIVKSVFELSQTLHISTIVEGIETSEQLKRFTDMGYRTFQGYYFSRPLSRDDCLSFIREFNR